MTLDKIIQNSGNHFKLGLSENSVVKKNRVKLEFKNGKVVNEFLEKKHIRKD